MYKSKMYKSKMLLKSVYNFSKFIVFIKVHVVKLLYISRYNIMGKIISICNYHKNKFSNHQGSPSRIEAKKYFLFVLLNIQKRKIICNKLL